MVKLYEERITSTMGRLVRKGINSAGPASRLTPAKRILPAVRAARCCERCDQWAEGIGNMPAAIRPAACFPWTGRAVHKNTPNRAIHAGRAIRQLLPGAADNGPASSGRPRQARPTVSRQAG